ncbi:hypothetical protein P775_09365 [Puniceibacterium antarcticum]|uniref:ABC transporter domain-containing protein n=1 Tax=Puniceibacterium antarcticum TaxID=1206336 RepID=A0A2G8RGM8_9RHOB|nr:hypothetical protein [Puniceibacterium antarcticum]PIL20724.1 hypothetical protein P775_09365 [Puniceibacterium antarcticum]
MPRERYDGPILKIDGLSVSFAAHCGDIPAVTEFPLRVMPGEAVVFVLEYGSSKSTVALGMMQDMGRNIATLSACDLRRLRGHAIAIIYQPPVASLNPAMKVGAQLMKVPMMTVSDM